MLPSLGGMPSQTILHRYSIIRVSCALAAIRSLKAQVFLFEHPLAQHTIRLAAAARAAEKNLPQTVDELSAALPAAAMPIGRRRSSAFPDILLFPLLSRHRLVADAVDRLHLHDVGEHAEVLADRNQRRVLVVHLDAQRAVGVLRDLGDRGGRLVADLVGVHDRHPRHQDHHGLAVLALLGPGDELVAPAHDLADVRKAEELELADDLLDRHLGALAAGHSETLPDGPALPGRWPR